MNACEKREKTTTSRLTPGQKALWYVHNISTGNCAYNINLAWHVKEGLDTKFLKNAIETVMERHPTMKTTYFVGSDGELFQKINPEIPLEFEEVDCGGWSEKELKDVLTEESYRAFDLENGPVSRWTLFCKGPDDDILFFSIHHIATDYPGIVMIFTDLSILLAGTELPELEESPGYDIFVKHMESRSQGPRKKKLAGYWEQQLKDSITPLNLPLDFPRPPIPDYRGKQATFSVPGPLFEKITRQADATGITLYTFFISAFAILLNRYASQDTVLIASPVSCKTPEFRHLSGYCVNPVVLKADLSDNPAVTSFLGSMNKRVFSAFYHKDYPFSVLSETLQPVREPGIPPIAQVMYNHIDFKNFQQGGTPLIDLTDDGKVQWYMGSTVWDQLDFRGQTDEFDLILETCFTDERAVIHLMYNENLFRHETIKRMGHHYLILLESLAADRDMPVSRLSMLTSMEKDLLFSAWGQAEKKFEKDACYHTWFEDQVRMTPDAPALYFQEETYTFQDLENRANQTAHFLKRKGAGTETLVGICMDRTPLTIICLLAILKCGAAYVPLDPGYPEERLAYIIEDAGLKLILTKRSSKERVAQTNAQIVCVDREIESIAGEPMTQPVRDVTLFNACYVIYTSGSTGHPKGVVIEHRCLSALINSCSAIFTKEELTGVLAAASLNFDLSVLDLLVPLALGGTVILADHPMSLPFLPAKDKIRLIMVVPSTMKALLQIKGVPRSAVTIGLAGDYLKKELVNDILALGHVKKVYNLYGPTEETAIATTAQITTPLENDPPIGPLLAKSQGYILDRNLQPVPLGVPGELCLAGVGLAREYLNRPELTREKFIPHPFCPGERMYRTGDLAAFMPDGQIKYMGRIDFQVKIRGFRIELGEIEAVIQSHGHVKESLVTVAEDRTGEKVLVAYVVPDNIRQLSDQALRGYLKDQLPSFMVPTHIMFLDVFPLNPNGKIDRKTLPEPEESKGMESKWTKSKWTKSKWTKSKWTVPEEKPQKASGNTIDIITGIWKDVLRIPNVDPDDNFFDIGGHSLLMVSLFSKLKETFDADITLVDLYKYTTIRSQADFVGDSQEENDTVEPVMAQTSARAGVDPSRKIAIVGMACRYPGARDKADFWHNIKNKVESISEFTEAELEENGVPLSIRRHRDFIPRSGWVDGLESFDAGFFNISPREAQIIDPQHRIFMELAWTALEDAGIDLDRTDCLTGIYAGGGQNSYLANHLNQDVTLRQQMGDFNLMIGNSIDFLSSRIGYKFNLKGPMPAVQTACSTSMTGIHMACNGLLHRDCDVALAGGVSLGSLKKGYLYQEGMILSANGQCRPFDRDASGTVPSQGAGIVVLKRLEDAIRDRHHIYSVILGSAINNDGIGKAGFTAPSVNGQMNVIKKAQKQANVIPDQISYIEAHGTGTNVGDPIETAALEAVFSESDFKKGPCAIGAVKGNIGHTDIASGVAGIIKTALALKYKQLPPTLHYKNPNSHIKFTEPAFYVNTRLKPWATQKLPRRAGVSSFGLGGNNAHTILEEYNPPFLPRETGWQLLPVSGKTSAALSTMVKNLGDHLIRKPKESLANVAYTLQIGRKQFGFRQFIVADTTTAAVDMLTDLPGPVQAGIASDGPEPGVVFMFTGQGAQYPDMGKMLYRSEPVFRKVADQCMEMLALVDTNLYNVFKRGKNIWDIDDITETHITQPGLFIFEYALARLLMHWGIRPDYMVGHSLGEYVAACIAGIFSLEDALTAVVLRGQLIRELPPGEMVSVGVSEEQARELMPEGLCVAAVNTPTRTVVSGSSLAVQKFQDRCLAKNILTIPLKTSHAFHSNMLDPVLKKFRSVMESLDFYSAKIPIVSNVTGTWLSDKEASDPGYWVNHMRHPVRFSDGITALFKKDKHMTFVEVGPGRVLTSLVLQHPEKQKSHTILQTMPGPKEIVDDKVLLLKALGKLWTKGIVPDWNTLHNGNPERIPLPTYPFERKRYWVDAVVPEETVLKAEQPVPVQEIRSGKTRQVSVLPRPVGEGHSAIEKAVIKVWEKFLGLDGILPEDDFFELGGDSLLAVMLLNHLQEEFKVDISPNSLISNSTVSRLAQVIRDLVKDTAGETNTRPWPEGVVELKSGADFPPLFLCHPGAGQLYFYTDLVKALDIPNPVYGIEAKGIHGQCEPLNSIEKIARYHLKGILAVQEKGPYYLGGSSFGGMVAYEVARQLIERGEEVELLYMVDTPGPGHMIPPVRSNAQILTQLFFDILEEKNMEEELLKFENNPEKQVEIIVEKAHSMDKKEMIPRQFGTHFVTMVRGHVNAMRQYSPRPYPGFILFFRQTEIFEDYDPHSEMAWLPLAEKGANVYTIPGNHFTMNAAPNVNVIARQIKRHISDLLIK